MRSILFFLPLLTSSVFPKQHRCSQCIEEGAKEIERYWHGASYVRLLYNDKWPTCEQRTNVTSEVGCFQVKMSKGAVPKGTYYVMQGPMSSLLTVNGYDLRQRHLEGRQTITFADDTEFEFTYCQAEKCFMDLPPRIRAKPLPDPGVLNRDQRTSTQSATTSVSPITEEKAALASKPAESDVGIDALLSPWVLLYMLILSFVCGLLAFFAGFAVAYYCELSWEKRMCRAMKFHPINGFELAPMTTSTTTNETTTDSSPDSSPPSSCCSSFTA